MSRIEDLIKSSDATVFSFDIFDTLLLRPYIDPQEVWRVMEIEENAAGFAAERKQADAVTYQKAIERNGETTIDEAYLLIPKWNYLKQKELDKERSVLRANPEMLSLWNELGIQGRCRVIVSDMYLPGDFLKSVLREKGIDGWDGFFLSSDYGCRKSSGKLFEAMLKKMDVKPGEVLHIGDNKQSDVDIPQKLGMNSFHYPKVSGLFFDTFPFARSINPRLAGALAIGWHFYKCEFSDATYWNRLGFIMGGVLGYMYVSWIVDTAKQRGINRLLFVARDGYVLQKICNDLYPEIQTDYVYAPRLTSIAVNGAEGNDPSAVNDRKKYINTSLNGVDIEKIREEYTEYLTSLHIDEHTALVDGCSSGFSAQRLMETCSGTSLFTFYLLSMAEHKHAAALYRTNLYCLPFQMLSEFLFCAPTHPVIGVSETGPIYREAISKEEEFKISVSDEIKDGAVACAKTLQSLVQNIKAEEWLSYADAFMSKLTLEDSKYLAHAKNAVDVEQKLFTDTIWSPMPERGFRFVHNSKFSWYAEFVKSGILYSYYLYPKGFEHSKKDISVRYSVINP